MSEQTIGTCSLCGGAVRCPRVYHSVIPPTPKCAHCGARAAQHGPVIPMEPARPQTPPLPLTEWPEPVLDAWRRFL